MAMRYVAGVFVALSWAMALAGAQNIYVERGDAGDLPTTAQLVQDANARGCQTPVDAIQGTLGEDDVDMYVICITNPANFSAATVGLVEWDTQLWLFRCDGRGVVFNDDFGGLLQSRIDNSTGCIAQSGIYLLTISRYNRFPVNYEGQPLWDPGGNPGGIRCPDGVRPNDPVFSWSGSTPLSGEYTIILTGAYFVNQNGCCITAGGDVDLNGCINNADLLRVLFAFGQSGAFLPEDVTCDGVVNNADLLTVLFNFGQGC
ncbi:MAG: hypothetical protein RMJ83_09545 [Armatimonadota bacterium]|nr:hypothetical protein [Armatimonadota bacterium]